jgi:hypothetical protein
MAHGVGNDKAGSNGAATVAGGLLPQHLADLRKSGLSDATIAACGFTSYVSAAEVARLLGWDRPAKHMAPSWGVPFPGPDGKPTGYVRIKPDNPRTKEGKRVKYESPLARKHKGNRAFFPPGTLPLLADPTRPLVVTEGEKKAAKADQEGIPCLGAIGVWGWAKKREKKVKGAAFELIDDLAAVAWQGRTVYLCYDSDLAEKVEVQWAEYRLAQALAARGAEVRVVRLPPGPKGAKVGLDDFLVANGPEAFSRLAAAAEFPAPPKDPRPKVVVDLQEHKRIAEVIAALAGRDETLYQRGGLLVRVVSPPRPELHAGAGAACAPKIEPVPEANLRTRIVRHTRLVKIGKGEGGEPAEILTQPPGWLIKGVMAADEWRGVRPLEAVVSAPVLLPDGTVLQEPGYCEAAGLLYRPPPGAEFEAVPPRPTRDDARRAAGELLDVICDFPFKADAHKAAWLAGLLTPLARFAFPGPAPLFFIDANVRAAGKGLLTDVVGEIVEGRPFARKSYVNNAEGELRKQITSIALEGERLVLFDNVIGSFGRSEALEAALTATVWGDRLLGTNAQPRLPLVSTWFATGNNVAFSGDISRRICLIRLESPDERPEVREASEFKRPDLLAWVRANRGRLLAAALTVLSAYCRAGRPAQPLKPWGSYEGWSALVRGAVVWCGLDDPRDACEEVLTRSDRDAETVRGLIAGWREIAPEGDGMTVNKALELLKGEGGEGKCPTLREVLADVFDLPHGRLPPAGKLGYVLRKYRGRNVGGYCLDSDPGHGGVQKWRVRAVASRADPGGRGGDGGHGGHGGDGCVAFAHAGATGHANGHGAGSPPPCPPSPPSPSTAAGCVEGEI